MKNVSPLSEFWKEIVEMALIIFASNVNKDVEGVIMIIQNANNATQVTTTKV